MKAKRHDFRARAVALALACAASGPLQAQDLNTYVAPGQQTVGGFNRIEGVRFSEFLGRAVHLMPQGVSVQRAITGQVEPQDDWPVAGHVREAVVSPAGRVLYLVVDIAPLVGRDEHLVSVSMDTLVFVQDPDAPGEYVVVYGEDPALLTGYDEWFWDEDLPLAGPELEVE